MLLFLVNIRAFNIFSTQAFPTFAFDWLNFRWTRCCAFFSVFFPVASEIWHFCEIIILPLVMSTILMLCLTGIFSVSCEPLPLIRHLLWLHHSHAPASFSSGLSAFSTRTFALIRAPSCSRKTRQLSHDGCLVRWCGHYCGICSNAFITAIKSLHISDIARTRGSQLSALQTLIWPSQAESEGITKINWVVFKFNMGCMFSLSTGGLLNQSAAWHLNISDE